MPPLEHKAQTPRKKVMAFIVAEVEIIATSKVGEKVRQAERV